MTQHTDISSLKERYESLHNLYESGDWIRDMKLDAETTADVLETFESIAKINASNSSPESFLQDKCCSPTFKRLN